MMYEFRPGLFCVYNTGAGRPYHESRVVDSQDHYCPIKVWELPHTLSRAELSHFIYKLLLAHIYTSPERQHTKQLLIREDDLYNHIFPYISFLGGNEMSATTILPVEHWPHAIKQFGAYGSSLRILELMMQLQLPHPRDWFSIHCQFKLYVLKDFIFSELNESQRIRYSNAQITDVPIEELRSLFENINIDTQEHILAGIKSTVIDIDRAQGEEKNSTLLYFWSLDKTPI